MGLPLVEKTFFPDGPKVVFYAELQQVCPKRYAKIALFPCGRCTRTRNGCICHPHAKIKFRKKNRKRTPSSAARSKRHPSPTAGSGPQCFVVAGRHPPDPCEGAAVASFEAQGSPCRHAPSQPSATRRRPRRPPPVMRPAEVGPPAAWRPVLVATTVVEDKEAVLGSKKVGCAEQPVFPLLLPSLVALSCRWKKLGPPPSICDVVWGGDARGGCGWEREPCGGPLHCSLPALWPGYLRLHCYPRYLCFLDTSNSNAQSLYLHSWCHTSHVQINYVSSHL